MLKLSRARRGFNFLKIKTCQGNQKSVIIKLPNQGMRLVCRITEKNIKNQYLKNYKYEKAVCLRRSFYFARKNLRDFDERGQNENRARRA